MGDRPDEVRAAVPLGAARGIGPVHARPEEEQAPRREQQPMVVRKRELMRAVRLRCRREALEIRVHRVGIVPADAGIARVGKDRIEPRAVPRVPVMQRAPEVVGGPAADSRPRIRRDVRREEGSEGCRDGATAGKGLTADRRVARAAVGECHELSPALDRIRARRVSRRGRFAALAIGRNEPDRDDRNDGEGYRNHNEPPLHGEPPPFGMLPHFICGGCSKAESARASAGTVCMAR